MSQALERIRQLVPSHTRGRSRMRESRTYGSGRGACHETHVPTATTARVHHAARRRGGAWPLAARAQQPTMPVIGFLDQPIAGRFCRSVARVSAGLKETGYVEGENVAIEYRWAENQIERLPELAAELVRRRVAVIAAARRSPAFAAKAATRRSRSCSCRADDPVKLRSRREPCAAGRQPDGDKFFQRSSWRQSAWSSCVNWCRKLLAWRARQSDSPAAEPTFEISNRPRALWGCKS